MPPNHEIKWVMTNVEKNTWTQCQSLESVERHNTLDMHHREREPHRSMHDRVRTRVCMISVCSWRHAASAYYLWMICCVPLLSVAASCPVHSKNHSSHTVAFMGARNFPICIMFASERTTSRCTIGMQSTWLITFTALNAQRRTRARARAANVSLHLMK